jgi:hypothetical protein
MASISTMLVGKYIYSQLQGIGQSNFFLEATLNRMKSVVKEGIIRERLQLEDMLRKHTHNHLQIVV